MQSRRSKVSGRTRVFASGSRVREIVNRFRNAKESMKDSGELSPSSLEDIRVEDLIRAQSNWPNGQGLYALGKSHSAGGAAGIEERCLRY